MSPGRPKKMILNALHSADPTKGHNTGLEGFVDIDDVMPRSQRTSTSLQNSLYKSVRPSIETMDTGNEFEEEYQVTETISRVETRTRKSFSRVPSVTEIDGPLPAYPQSAQAPTSRFTESDVPMVKSGGAVQVAASPSSRSVKNLTESTQTSKRRQKRRLQNTVQDSEDDDVLSDVEKRTSCSPCVSVKNSARVIDSSKSPSWRGVPPFEPAELKFRDVKEPKSRTGSPLQPISRNVSARQESVPSPFQRDSPTKLSVQSKSLKQPSSQQTPASSLGPDDKKLVSLYLKKPSAISLYRLHVKNILAQNSNTSMRYIDDEMPVPPHLKEERKTLLEMSKAYSTLEGLAERWRGVMTEKRNLLKKICELLDIGQDTSTLEERSSSLTLDIRKIEKEVGQFLHVSGAIKDGFGTDSELDDAVPVSRAESSKANQNMTPLPSESSVISSAQVVLQTQIPDLAQKSTFDSSQRMTEEYPPMYSSRGETSTTLLDCASPSPVRHAVRTDSFPAPQHSTISENDWISPRGGMKQPDFYRDPPPINYGVDADDDLFDDLLQGEHELHNDANVVEEIPDVVEDDYGDSDDYEDMVEVAQEVEKRHSLPESITSRPGRTMSSKSFENVPESSKRNRSTVKRNMYSHVDPERAGLLRHPWSEDVKKALKERFKLTGFRYHQLDAINATLAGNDAFVLMPTGGGKSLCYQLPAVIQSGKTRGVTIVISPLLSLMNDQIQHLRKINIRAATLNSGTTGEERSEIHKNLKETYPEQFIQLLYITPEMITKSNHILTVLSRLHQNKKLARIVIDEAHCVSQWGHDFRPDYVALGQVRKRFPNVPIMALTATATENVKVDVMHQLGMGECPVYSQSFNRPNLHYEVRKKKGKGMSKEFLQEIVDMIKVKFKNQSGIIYTLSRKGTQKLAAILQNDYKIKAHHYHADMPVQEKSRVQQDWQSGKIQVVVATIAFGMGIDKADVRFVIHHTIPKSLEGYYQETGRAGRDGKKAGCYLYYGYSDTAALKRFIYDSDANPEQKERQRRMLSNMIQFCENRSDCRRVQVLAYFGERFSKEECEHTCDNCSSDTVFESVDFTAHAQTAMRIVKQLQDDNVTLLHCVDILRGATSKKIKDGQHQDIQGFGAARDVARGEVERLYFRLLMENALAEHNVMKGGFASQYLHVSILDLDSVSHTNLDSLGQIAVIS
jgi:bloom syndrome protein